MIVASGSGSRKRGTLLAARRKILDGLGIEMLDIFFAEYINPRDDPDAIFGARGVLDELERWKAEGVIRYVARRPTTGSSPKSWRSIHGSTC